ncbi:hypothetical protein BDZ89DRAFT_1159179 [Hymenopellis radicata]|nr:hypothetical protein BDZ89DRAFT_1159179 [Hymenopellis radicata]
MHRIGRPRSRTASLNNVSAMLPSTAPTTQPPHRRRASSEPRSVGKRGPGAQDHTLLASLPNFATTMLRLTAMHLALGLKWAILIELGYVSPGVLDTPDMEDD